jgi:hypothetical protein
MQQKKKKKESICWIHRKNNPRKGHKKAATKDDFDTRVDMNWQVSVGLSSSLAIAWPSSLVIALYAGRILACWRRSSNVVVSRTVSYPALWCLLCSFLRIQRLVLVLLEVKAEGKLKEERREKKGIRSSSILVEGTCTSFRRRSVLRFCDAWRTSRTWPCRFSTSDNVTLLHHPRSHSTHTSVWA